MRQARKCLLLMAAGHGSMACGLSTAFLHLLPTACCHVACSESNKRGDCVDMPPCCYCMQSTQRELESKWSQAVHEASSQASASGGPSSVLSTRAGARRLGVSCCWCVCFMRHGNAKYNSRPYITACTLPPAAVSFSVRELEGWTKQEMLQLAAKLKVVVQSCSNHQQQINLQASIARSRAGPLHAS